MIYTYQIEGIPVQTGDIICTMNGKPDILPGEFWRFIGRLVPRGCGPRGDLSGTEWQMRRSGRHAA